MTVPKIVDIEQELQKGKANFSRYSTPEHNKKIQLMLDLLGLPNELIDLEKILRDKDDQRIANHLVSYAIRHGYADYTQTWYRWLKRKINEFNYRYIRRIMIYKDTSTSYKKLFKLFIQISLEFDILTHENAGNELSYFIAAQYAAKFELGEGLLAPVNYNTFTFKNSYSNYKRLKMNGFPPTLIGIDFPIHLSEFKPDPETSKSLKWLKDHEFAPYINIAVPIINRKIPKLNQKSQDWVMAYIHSIEILMVREDLLHRYYNKFLLSIEHLRVHTELLRKYSGQIYC